MKTAGVAEVCSFSRYKERGRKTLMIFMWPLPTKAQERACGIAPL
jgi:hypothetical protein